jgi:hypothetical protein
MSDSADPRRLRWSVPAADVSTGHVDDAGAGGRACAGQSRRISSSAKTTSDSIIPRSGSTRRCCGMSCW